MRIDLIVFEGIWLDGGFCDSIFDLKSHLHDSWKSLDPRYDCEPSFGTHGVGPGALYHFLMELL
jgi:hypothetical protein